jgi:hypothetical protein
MIAPWDPLQMYNNNRKYHGEGYTLLFLSSWTLFYNSRQIMRSDSPNFWEIVNMLELKPWKESKENEQVGYLDPDEYMNQVAENLSSWRELFPDIPELIEAEKRAYKEYDTCFTPSLAV